MAINQNKEQSIQSFLKNAKSQSWLALALWMLLVCIGGLVFYYFSNPLIKGVGISSALFGLAALASQGHHLFFYCSYPLSNQASSAAQLVEKVKQQNAHAKQLLLLDSLCFFLGFILVVISAFFLANKFLLGIAMALTFLGAIKWSADLFMQWSRTEFIRRMNKFGASNSLK